MSDKKLVYPVCLLVTGEKYFLLWKDGGSEPDMYLTVPGTENVVVASSMSELRSEVKKMKLLLSDNDPAIFDVDVIMKDIARIGSGPCSTHASSRILDGWNNLEDLAKSINIKLEMFGEMNKLKSIYEKFFFGNNIPAVTPSGSAYHPVFSKEERRLMRSYLRRLWRVIAERIGANIAS